SGTDISPIQPSWVPSNARFEIEDAKKEWTFQPNYFDYIHIPWLTGTIADWPALYKEVYKCTAPGGWIEHLDDDVEGLKEAGFTNVTTEAIYSDDPKMKQVGLYLSATLTHDVDGFLTYLLHNYENWTPQEIHNYAPIMRKEIRERKIHSNSKWRVVRGQKPLDT
ncbi:hypothetical protein B0T09DRAFT_401080, partial [Sordaria sp. MPI-SDFR-AT-0083]